LTSESCYRAMPQRSDIKPEENSVSPAECFYCGNMPTTSLLLPARGYEYL
jgi:hypothetical protein